MPQNVTWAQRSFAQYGGRREGFAGRKNFPRRKEIRVGNRFAGVAKDVLRPNRQGTKSFLHPNVGRGADGHHP